MSARYRRIIKLREKKLTFEQIGEALGVSRQRAWQMYDRAIKRQPKKRLA